MKKLFSLILVLCMLLSYNWTVYANIEGSITIDDESQAYITELYNEWEKNADLFESWGLSSYSFDYKVKTWDDIAIESISVIDWKAFNSLNEWVTHPLESLFNEIVTGRVHFNNIDYVEYDEQFSFVSKIAISGGDTSEILNFKVADNELGKVNFRKELNNVLARLEKIWVQSGSQGTKNDIISEIDIDLRDNNDKRSISEKLKTEKKRLDVIKSILDLSDYAVSASSEEGFTLKVTYLIKSNGNIVTVDISSEWMIVFENGKEIEQDELDIAEMFLFFVIYSIIEYENDISVADYTLDSNDLLKNLSHNDVTINFEIINDWVATLSNTWSVAQENISDTKVEVKNKEYTFSKTKPQFSKQSIIAKSSLNKTSKFRKYISQIDLVAEKMSIEKLEKIMTRLATIPESTRDTTKYKDIFDYLEAKIMLRLLEEK